MARQSCWLRCLRWLDVKCRRKCGSWLACESGGSVGISVTERSHSRASPLPHLNCVPGWDLAFTAGGFMVEAPPNRFEMPSNMWERACLRKRWISRHICHCKTAIAGKPAPTVGPRSGVYCRWLYRVMHRSVNLKCGEKCGSWLACESGGSVGISVTERPHSRASPLPHFDCVESVTSAPTAVCAVESGVCCPSLHTPRQTAAAPNHHRRARRMSALSACRYPPLHPSAR